MRDWSLHSGDPLYLSMAADARLCNPDYLNDHIWEVEVGAVDPERSAVALNTTFGLRARSMRIYFRFIENNVAITDPDTFIEKPSLKYFYPNSLSLDFVPLEALPVSVEYWVPESHAVVGRITLTNKSTTQRLITLELCAALSPIDGQSIIPTQQQLVNVLAGQTSGIAPVIFMTGGPKHGVGRHPSLVVELELGPGATRQLTFSEAALDAIATSFELARRSAARPWEAERTRIQLLNLSQTISIKTGDTDWDAAFAFSQTAALGLFLGNGQYLPYPSFVNARQPDHGFSRKGDGTDYPPSWQGVSSLDVYYITGILQGVPQLTKKFIANFLSTQNDEGEVDGKPGLVAQRGRTLAMPLLASLAWTYFQKTGDEAFLSEIFQKLVKFFWAWFSNSHDRNRDGVPEWDNVLQTGFDDNPIFDVWHPGSQGLDPSLVHSPSLEAMLYREAITIQKIARQLTKPEEETVLVASQAEILKKSITAGWNPDQNNYIYRDRDSHKPANGRVIATQKGNGSLRLKEKFDGGVRLLLEIQTENQAAQRPEVEIREYVSKTKGEVEIINSHQFQWRMGGLITASKKIFTRISQIHVAGLDENDIVIIKLIDTTSQDLTLALPLWAQVPNAQQAGLLIEHNLMANDWFNHQFGLSAFADFSAASAESTSRSILLPWNQMIIEGLLAYGYRAESAQLITSLMKAVVQNLKEYHSFFQRYDSEKGTGIGERNSLFGFAPVGLFMKSLGVTILSSKKVILEGKNPYPWAVTIRYKGLIIVRGLEQTVVTFQNGESIIVKQEDPCVVELPN